jgi:Fur family ferric uptake transcriptional regulator
MCHQCNYEELLSGADLETTPNRVRVLEVVGNNSFPLSASDIYKILKRSSTINRVTVYRILDLLVENGIVESHQHRGKGILLWPGAQ